MPSPRLADLVRPSLRPGLHVVRRDAGHLQLGLDPPDRAVIEDAPGLLDALCHPHRPAPPELAPVLDELVRGGWIVDAEGPPAPARAPVAVRGDPAVVPRLLRACAAGGLEVVDADAAAVTVVGCVGEPPRALTDQLMRDDVAHLWLTALPSSVRLGPLVQPGRTSCLRCVDAHRADLDPRRPTVLLQLDSRPPAELSIDPVLLELGVAWAVRDLMRALDGQAATLASATVSIADSMTPERREWPRHPRCGCAWGPVAVAG